MSIPAHKNTTQPAGQVHFCEYFDCTKPATCWSDELKAWLCDKHSEEWKDNTGYCSQYCCLGHGCDDSC